MKDSKIFLLAIVSLIVGIIFGAWGESAKYNAIGTCIRATDQIEQCVNSIK